jgi:predicted transcriptional regulator of viral defense system
VHIGEVREFMSRTPAFRAKDIEVLVKDRGYALLLLHKLAKKGEVHRITRGWYSRSDDPVVSVFAFRPAYLGLEEALSLRGLWEQETNVVLVTPRRIRQGRRNVMGSTVVVHRIDRGRYFGFDYLRYGDFFVPVSDVEKTVIDLAYFGRWLGSEVLSEVKGRLDHHKLTGYLEAYSPALRERVGSLLGV